MCVTVAVPDPVYVPLALCDCEVVTDGVAVAVAVADPVYDPLAVCDCEVVMEGLAVAVGVRETVAEKDCDGVGDRVGVGDRDESAMATRSVPAANHRVPVLDRAAGDVMAPPAHVYDHVTVPVNDTPYITLLHPT